MQKLKREDEIIVLKGKDRGKIGKIKKLDFRRQRVLVEGVNRMKKAIRPTQQNPQGDVIDKEFPIHLSNVALVSPKTKNATRVRIEIRDGKRIRMAVACGSILKDSKQ